MKTIGGAIAAGLLAIVCAPEAHANIERPGSKSVLEGEFFKNPLELPFIKDSITKAEISLENLLGRAQATGSEIDLSTNLLIEKYNKFLMLDSDQKKAIAKRAVYFSNKVSAKGFIEDAIKLIDYAMDLNPGNPRYMGNKALLLSIVGSYPLAHKYIREALKIDPNKATRSHYYNIMGMIYAGEKKIEDAQKAYSESLKYGPRNGYSHLALGDIFRAKNMPDKARGHYMKAIEYLSGDLKVRAVKSLMEMTKPDIKK
ncbi:tetratricopeptide repeat protein [Candidatus Woesearchaeota archaeon]|nr:tetratricopeptide repeat protein [Candidatus Woesearchaeota archaeon]OGQ41466.1 MAG: hypothetical protein A3A85_05020 [Deltaproteobacteria bacterium RIFCSPLOWO2_01_FULL_42_9]